MTDVFSIQVEPGRIIKVQANTPEEAAAGARKVLENERGGYSDKLAQSFGQGATLGYGDELTAAVRAAAPGFSNWMMSGPALQRDPSIGGSPTPQTVSTAPTFQGRYDEELARERAKLKEFEASNPVASTAANLAGNVATTALALPAVATSAAPSLVGNILKMGATGAALGGVQGYGQGEGEGRLGSAITGGAIGGTLGAAMPLVGLGARAAMESGPGRWVGEKVVSPLARTLSGGAHPVSLSAAADGGPPPSSWLSGIAENTRNVAQTGAVERAATAMQRGKLDPTSAQRRLTQLGDEAMLADVDPQFRDLARMAKTLPGQTRSHAETVLEGRERQYGPLLKRVFEGDAPPPGDFALMGEGQAFDQHARAVGRRVYGDMKRVTSINEPALRESPELKALYDNPAVKGAINRVLDSVEEARAGRPNAPSVSDVELVHMIKQEIQGLGFDKMTGRPLSTQQQWRDLSSEFVRLLKEANPKLAAADRAYAQAKSLPDFYEAGSNFMLKGMGEKARNASAPAIDDLLRNADEIQTLAARAGVTNLARSKAEGRVIDSLGMARFIDESTAAQAKLRAFYPAEQAEKIIQQASALKTFANTSNKVLRGSETADKIADVIDTGNAAVRIGGGGMTARAFQYVDDAINRLAGPNEAVRDELGRAMLNTNPEQNERLLRLAAAILDKRRAGTPVRAGLIEAASGMYPKETR